MAEERHVLDTSYWMTDTPTTEYPPLSADTTADVAVIGAGIAGLCTAWELTSAGLDVIVLEADRIASGVSGHTTAKLTSLHGLAYSRIEAEHGPGAGELYALAQEDALDHTAALCRRLHIDAQLERVPAHTYVMDRDREREIAAEAEAAAKAGLDVTLTAETELPFPVAAAVRAEGQLQFHPRAFLLALAERTAEAGARICERTRVTALHDGRRCRLATGDGAHVEARDAVVAVGYPAFDRSLLSTRLKPRRELVIAAPVPVSEAPTGMYFSPEDRVRSLRGAPYDERRRLLIVTGESFEPGAGGVQARLARLDAWASERLPGFAAAERVYRWAAQDNDSSDHLPYVGHIHPGTQHVYVATGFGGWGISNGVAAGKLIAAHVAGRPRPPWTELFDPRRLPHIRETAQIARFQTAVARHYAGDRLHTGHIDSADAVPPGTGEIVRLGPGRKRCAVYRDETGRASAVAARCTHEGCLVQFNDLERTWECPCHGSRFAVDGSVLQGPATRALEPRTAEGEPGAPPE
ncbi:FAD-dependent oxidoreductase [Streptomyces sp. PR69]|uniref:FAD-dependent oxidoreductase n=1 Tax=Streptomyces sp. PR69 TaxID=2984950 RepID=UPI00226522A2|nr:FAD-dependent oxidoreductase [Streptomyces sp. PR69]